jgi:hypothetical protein
MKQPGEGLAEILAAGKFPGFRMESSGPYVVDLQSPRGWGMNATKDRKGFAKHYNRHGQPVYRNNHEAKDAVLKANDHGERMEVRHSREM